MAKQEGRLKQNLNKEHLAHFSWSEKASIAKYALEQNRTVTLDNLRNICNKKLLEACESIEII